MTRRRDDTGASGVVELLFLVPLLFGVVALFVFWGRQGEAATDVTHAAAVGARAAALAGTEPTAHAAATTAVNDTLSAAGTACVDGATVDVVAEAWNPGALITVTVACRIAGEDLAVIAPPTRIARASATAIIDRYRDVP
jgi:Flp pilus assembly protein TadG